VRSIYPGVVVAGINSYSRDQKVMDAFLQTSGGTIKIHFAMNFPKNVLSEDLLADSVFAKRRAFIKALGAVTSKTFVVHAKSAPIPTWKHNEQLLAPIQKGEKLLVRYSGETAQDCYDPFCTIQRSYYPGILKSFTCGCMPNTSEETLLVSNSGACKPSFSCLHHILNLML
jgi:hypothetical protein